MTSSLSSFSPVPPWLGAGVAWVACKAGEADDILLCIYVNACAQANTANVIVLVCLSNRKWNLWALWLCFLKFAPKSLQLLTPHSSLYEATFMAKSRHAMLFSHPHGHWLKDRSYEGHWETHLNNTDLSCSGFYPNDWPFLIIQCGFHRFCQFMLFYLLELFVKHDTCIL